ncbi:hypothetical protein GCM10027098_26820 [Bowmanella dokdonensis]
MLFAFSLKQVTEHQVEHLVQSFTGKVIKNRQALPRAVPAALKMLVSGWLKFAERQLPVWPPGKFCRQWWDSAGQHGKGENTMAFQPR